MGMRDRATGGYQSGGTSSFPVTGFPASAYLGNNRRVGGGSQGQPSPMAGGIGQALQFNPTHSLVVLIVIIAVGYTLWHVDNR
jgi:hypothetical protein